MRKHINRLKTSFLLSALVFLAACGGGGGGSPISGGGDGGGGAADGAGVPASVTTPTLTDEDGGSINSLSYSADGSLTTISFTVNDSDGAAVPNATGSFEFDVPFASTKSGGSDVTTGAQKVVAAGSFTTNASGVASVSITINDPRVAGTGVLTITLDTTDNATVSFTENITVVQQAGVAVSFTTSLLQDEADDNSNITSISEANPGVVVASLVDFNGDPVVGKIITIASSLGELSPSSGNVLTSSSGQATADLTVGSAQPGEAGTVTVSVTDLPNQTINFDVADSGTTSTSGFNIVVGLYDSDVDLGDLAGSTQVSAVSTVSSAFFVATVTDTITGLPVEGAIVGVSSTVGTVTPSNGQILTNSNGIAAAEIGSGDADPGAAGTLTASIEDVQASINFAVGSVDLQLGRDANGFGDPDNIDFVNGEIAIGTTTDLAPNGTTSLTVVVVQAQDTATGFDTPLTVNFSSLCSASGLAFIDTGITTVNGIAAATYEANGCEGTDDITATVQELSGITATGSLVVADADANSIQFVSADPTNIALRGTGGAGRQEFSTLTFRVIDEAGSPISGEVVSVALSTTLGGISLTGDTNNDGDLDVADGEALTSNANGEVNVIVNAGTVPTSVRVEASITLTSGAVINTVSDNLVISTGLPDNNSFSLSASILSPGGFEFDGFTSILSVSAADAFNNPVPDGTTINFTTEYGRIVDRCTTVGGNCSATWNSQSPRTQDLSSTGTVLTINNTRCDSNHDGTADVGTGGTVEFGNPCPPLDGTDTNVAALTGSAFTSVLVDTADQTFPGQIFGGRTTIMAYAIGEESFIDSNGNGIYDWIDTDGDGEYDTGESLEPFVDLSETFVDHNEDGVFGNSLTPGGCTAVGAGTSIQTVVDVNDIDNDGNTTETVGEAELCADWQVGGAEEEFIDFDVDGVYDRGNGIYNGTLCSSVLESLATPLCTTQLVSVRDEVPLIVGGSTPQFGIYDNNNQLLNNNDADVDVTVGAADTDIRNIFISDVFNGRLPGGTQVNVSSTNCKIDSVTSFEIIDSNAFGNFSIPIILSEDTTASSASGTVSVEVMVPQSAGNITSTFSFGCIDAN